MTEITTNEKSFIKISEELRRLENSLEIVKAFKAFISRADNFAKTQLGNIELDKAFTAEIDAWVTIFPYISDSTKLIVKIEDMELRIKELCALQDVYLKGGDIVAAKLAATRD